MATMQSRLYNLQWRLLAVQNALEDLATEIQRLTEEVACKGQQEGSKQTGAVHG